jgi:hypothetical protein
VQGSCKRLVVRKNSEMSSLQEVPEVEDAAVDCPPLHCCCSTAPTCELDASVMRVSSTAGDGCANRVAAEMADLAA